MEEFGAVLYEAFGIYLTLVGTIGLILVIAGGAVAIFAVDRSRRAVRLRLLDGTARDRLGDKAASSPTKPSRVDTLVTSLGASVAAQDTDTSKLLRSRLVQAGYLAKDAIAYYFAARVAGGVIGAALTFMLLAFGGDALVGVDPVVGLLVGGLIGYFTPSFALGRLIKKRQTEHREGFPDFMDLMVVCAQAGLSMEAGIQRIATELKSGFPSLCLHLDLTSLELRSGKPMAHAMVALGHRLGIDEATSFATLLQQSEELGSSISESLRAYSDDMRNKRLMKAEEKAYSLPAKLVVPLTLFVFPVLLVVLLLPAVVAVKISMS